MKTLPLQLGRYELIYLLWMMKTLSLPGMGSKPFGAMSDEKATASLITAKQSLQARGLIGVQEAEVKINPHALNLVGTCALAKASLMMESQRKDSAPEALYFHFHSRVWVRHSILDRGVHKFSLVESPLSDLTNLVGVIPAPEQRDTPSEFTLPQAVIDLVFALFSNKRLFEAQNELGIARLPVDLAEVLLDTLSDLQQKIYIGVTFRNSAENQPGESVVLIRNTQGLWRAESLADNGAVRLTSISQQETADLFNQIVRQAQVA
jgi:hypothetical protein